MTLRTILIDDEPLALERLRRMLAPYADTIEVVGVARDGADAVTVINDVLPDVVFLDVQMPELSGFDVLEHLEYIPLIVFTTAYDQYALKAFEVNSVDYLMKPVDPVRLKTAVAKLQRLSGSAAEELRERIRDAGDTMRHGHRTRLQVRVGDRIRFVPMNEVVYFQASDKYVEIHTQDGSHLTQRSLSRLELELPSADFVRVHRSVIVNVNFIDEIAKTLGGSYEVRLKDAARTRLPVSRRHRSRLDLG